MMPILGRIDGKPGRFQLGCGTCHRLDVGIIGSLYGERTFLGFGEIPLKINDDDRNVHCLVHFVSLACLAVYAIAIPPKADVTNNIQISTLNPQLLISHLYSEGR